MAKEVYEDGPYGNLEPVIRARCPGCGCNGFEAVRGRYGPVWRCFEQCEFFLTSRPTGKKCRYKIRGKPCGALMVEGTRTIPDRCSRKDCPNHNPHLLAR